MKLLSLETVLLFLSCLLFSNCVQHRIQRKDQNKNELSAIELTSVLSAVDNNGETINIIDDKETVYSYGSLRMYQLPVYSYIASGDRIQDPLDSATESTSPVEFNYVVFKEGLDSVAFLYSSLTGGIKDTLLVSSFLSNGFRNFGEKYRQTNKFDVLFSSQKHEDNISEKYVPRAKLNDSFSDTTYLYFRKDYNDVKFSLVPELDSAKEMKLFKVLVLFKGNQKNNDPLYQKDRLLRLEIQKKVIKDPESIRALFKRFEEDKSPSAAVISSNA